MNVPQLQIRVHYALKVSQRWYKRAKVTKALSTPQQSSSTQSINLIESTPPTGAKVTRSQGHQASSTQQQSSSTQSINLIESTPPQSQGHQASSTQQQSSSTQSINLIESTPLQSQGHQASSTQQQSSSTQSINLIESTPPQSQGHQASSTQQQSSSTQSINLIESTPLQSQEYNLIESTPPQSQGHQASSTQQQSSSTQSINLTESTPPQSQGHQASSTQQQSYSTQSINLTDQEDSEDEDIQRAITASLASLESDMTYAEISQFLKGLNCVGSFCDVIRNNLDELIGLFTPTKEKLTAKILKSIYNVNLSPIGHNLRPLEQDSLYSFDCLLQDLEDGVAEISLHDLLMFWTGSSDIPPLGFHKQLEINFVENNEKKKKNKLPVAHTCDMSLELPRGVEDPSEMMRIMDLAVHWGWEFHLA
ncbi:hypothetical protein KUTeg_015276 [Tegillarca granosa]|uniref:HECT domain-containing protein n=1 Tax=Tegillarca granosa TaxID=220873 RepID=A0ABQ9EPN7_TEGGR|nr:hypothetical protein KUTeg_015276 [Tegillarca granosa]